MNVEFAKVYQLKEVFSLMLDMIEGLNGKDVIRQDFHRNRTLGFLDEIRRLLFFELT